MHTLIGLLLVLTGTGLGWFLRKWSISISADVKNAINSTVAMAHAKIDKMVAIGEGDKQKVKQVIEEIKVRL